MLADWDYQFEPGDELLYSIQNNELFASGTKFISWFGDEKFFSKEMRTLTRHGPALQFRAVDMVLCLPCKTWFSLTSDIFQRDAFRNYSDKTSLELLKEKGFHLVFTSHSDSLHPETEFRFSFSVIEKYLMRFWTKKQLQCYFLRKEIFKKYFKRDDQLTRHLCSYYGKTIIFWLIEEKPRTFWNGSLAEILKGILYKLRQFVIAKSCPNYFIPQNHMFDHFTDVETSTLLQRLNEVETSVLENIFSCTPIKYLLQNDFSKPRILSKSLQGLYILHWLNLSMCFSVEMGINAVTSSTILKRVLEQFSGKYAPKYKP